MYIQQSFRTTGMLSVGANSYRLDSDCDCDRSSGVRTFNNSAGHEAAGSSIINISSMAAVIGLPSTPGYTISKGALSSLTRQLAVDYADASVRVNALILGFIVHETTQAVVSTPELAAVTRSWQLTRLGIPDEVANAAIYLASDEYAFITGASLNVDGGTLAKAAQASDKMFDAAAETLGRR